MKYIAVVRGQLKATSQQEAQQVHDAIIEKLEPTFKPMGSIGHQAYLDPQNPKAFLGIDTWSSLEALQKFMNDPNVGESFGSLFEEMPEVTVWSESGWTSFYNK